MRRDPCGDSCPVFPDFMTRLSTLKLMARMCNLGPNPDAARPWRDSFPRFSDLMSRLSRLEHSAQICNLGLNLDAARPLADFCPDFSDLMTRLSRLKLSARLCNLGLNPIAARPLARFLSRLSRTDVQTTFQTRAVGANLQFGSKSGCGATLGATHVQTFQTLCPDFPDSNCWRESEIWD